MDSNKRKLNSKYSFNETKKFKKKKLITSIENLSNEILYDIFDYLDGCQTFQSFGNLNYRFDDLLKSSSFLFKIDDLFILNLNEIISLKKQIFSLKLYTSSHVQQLLSSSFITDSPLNHLQSFSISYVKSDVLIPILQELRFLTHLQSLTVHMCDVPMDIAKAYQLVFNLRTLKYYKFSISMKDLSVLLPIVTNEQFASIETLHIDHPCNFEEVSKIIWYTPELRNLKFTHGLNVALTSTIIPSIALPNLTCLSICMYGVLFDDFKIFMQNIHANLKTLKIITKCENLTYINSYRWEQLFLNHFPRLEKFYFTYCDHFKNDNRYELYSGELNPFFSSFWTERKWVFTVVLDGFDIKYLIEPFRKTWFSSTEDQNVESFHFPSLIFKNGIVLFDEIRYQEIKNIFNVKNIYHLTLMVKQSPLDLLLYLIQELPNLISCKFFSISLSAKIDLLDVNFLNVCLTSYQNQITKICFEELHKIEEFYSICTICPFMNFFQVERVYDMTIELFLSSLLNYINTSHCYIRVLCLNVPAADDDTLKCFKEIIKQKHLVIDFTIKRILNRIYLQWN